MRYGTERHNETLLRLEQRWAKALDDQRVATDAERVGQLARIAGGRQAGELSDADAPTHKASHEHYCPNCGNPCDCMGARMESTVCAHCPHGRIVDTDG